MNMIKKVALSVFRNRISSRLDSANKVLILTIENEKINKREPVSINTSNPLDKMHQIIQLKPDVLICGGITQLYESKLKDSNIKVIPWVKGNTQDILNQFLEGKL